MPKSKRITAYPVEYFELFERAASGEEVVVVLPSPREAESTRFDLYGFREALRLSNDGDQRTMELAILSDSLEFIVEESTLRVRSKDQVVRTEAIRNALRSGE